jgi:hypothetical protein
MKQILIAVLMAFSLNTFAAEAPAKKDDLPAVTGKAEAKHEVKKAPEKATEKKAEAKK